MLQSCLYRNTRRGWAVERAGGVSDSGLTPISARQRLLKFGVLDSEVLDSGVFGLCRLKRYSPADNSAGEYHYEFSLSVRALNATAIRSVRRG